MLAVNLEITCLFIFRAKKILGSGASRKTSSTTYVSFPCLFEEDIFGNMFATQKLVLS